MDKYYFDTLKRCVNQRQSAIIIATLYEQSVFIAEFLWSVLLMRYCR